MDTPDETEAAAPGAADMPETNIYQYVDYRAFLKDRFRWLQTRDASFSQRKLMRSLRQAGASEELAEEVWAELEPRLHSGMSSKQHQHHAFKLLKK